MSGWSTALLVAVFAAGVAATWLAGIRLADATERIDDRFNLGEAIGGTILLGLAGTLPELAITVAAATSGALALAAGNLLGGIAMQTLVLVLLDGFSGRPQPLSTMSDHLEPLFEAVVVIVTVTLALMGSLLRPGVSVGGASPVSIAIFLTWLISLFILNRMRVSPHWTAVEQEMGEMTLKHHHVLVPKRNADRGPMPNRYEHQRAGLVVVVFGLLAAITLVAGVVLEQSGDALATRYHINGAVFGATILAAVTALPEISTGLRAVSLGSVGLAMGDIFGGNALQMALFLLADLIAGKPVLTAVGADPLWLGGLGVVVTGIYVVGLLIRPARKRLGLGADSWIVLAVYGIGVAMLPLLVR